MSLLASGPRLKYTQSSKVTLKSDVFSCNFCLACLSWSEGWFLFDELTVVHLWGVVYPLFGPGIVIFIHSVWKEYVMSMAQKSADLLSLWHRFFLCFHAILLSKDLVFSPYNLWLCNSRCLSLPWPRPCHQHKSSVDGGGGKYTFRFWYLWYCFDCVSKL